MFHRRARTRGRWLIWAIQRRASTGGILLVLFLDNDDPVQVVGHDHEGIQFNAGETFGQALPLASDDTPKGDRCISLCMISPNVQA